MRFSSAKLSKIWQAVITKTNALRRRRIHFSIDTQIEAATFFATANPDKYDYIVRRLNDERDERLAKIAL
jgi:hypothetical protein